MVVQPADGGGGRTITELGVKLLQHRKAAYYPPLAICVLLAAFLLDNLVFGPKIGGTIGNYLLPILMWLLLILLFLNLPGIKTAGKLRLRRTLRWMALVSVLIAVVAAVLQGFVGGFGKSPYDHSWLGIPINLLTQGTALVALEICRAWLVNRFFRQRPFWGIVGIALFFTFLLFPLTKFFSLQNVRAVTEFIGGSFFPELAQNILTTYMAFLGGPVPAIIYQAGLLVFERLSPVLPSSENWVMAALIGTLIPLVTLIVVQQLYADETKKARYSRPQENYLTWVGTGMASVLIIWFCLGVFSYSPRVILSGSMVPVMNIGDVVIIHKITGTEAKMGDIIMFPMGSMKVTHRIIAIQEEDGERFFVTKGDANQDPESDLLTERQVQGKVVLNIPKLGYITLLLRGAI